MNLNDLAESKYVSIISGKMSLNSYEQFKSDMDDLPDEILIDDDLSTDKEFKILVIITLKENEDKISSLLRKLEFERFDLTGITGKPEEVIKKSESRLNEIEKEKESISNDLAVISDEWLNELLVLKEQLEIEKQRSEIF